MVYCVDLFFLDQLSGVIWYNIGKGVLDCLKIERSRSSSSSFFCFFNLDGKGRLDYLKVGKDGSVPWGRFSLYHAWFCALSPFCFGFPLGEVAPPQLLVQEFRFCRLLRGFRSIVHAIPYGVGQAYLISLLRCIASEMEEMFMDGDAEAELGELIELPEVISRYVVVKDLHQKPFLIKSLRAEFWSLGSCWFHYVHADCWSRFLLVVATGRLWCSYWLYILIRTGDYVLLLVISFLLVALYVPAGRLSGSYWSGYGFFCLPYSILFVIAASNIGPQTPLDLGRCDAYGLVTSS
ncbi:hypothetical protein Tco_0155735 [Tanacetum coccineum]